MVYTMRTKHKGAIVMLPSSAKARAGKLLRACTGLGGSPTVTQDGDEIEIASRNKGRVFCTEDSGDTWWIWEPENPGG